MSATVANATPIVNAPAIHGWRRRSNQMGISFSSESPASDSNKGSTATELGPPHVPIVPMSVKAPVAASMLYIETLFEPEFVTYANLPVGSTATEAGPVPAAI